MPFSFFCKTHNESEVWKYPGLIIFLIILTYYITKECTEHYHIWLSQNIHVFRKPLLLLRYCSDESLLYCPCHGQILLISPCKWKCVGSVVFIWKKFWYFDIIGKEKLNWKFYFLISLVGITAFKFNRLSLLCLSKYRCVMFVLNSLWGNGNAESLLQETYRYHFSKLEHWDFFFFPFLFWIFFCQLKPVDKLFPWKLLIFIVSFFPYFF